MEESEKMTTQEDVTEESASESENISEDDVDDEDAGEESSQASVLTLQESEEPPVSALTGAGPATGEAGCEAQDELKAASEMCTEDMEVALSKAVSAIGGLTPTSSQDVVIIHTTEEEVRNLN